MDDAPPPVLAPTAETLVLRASPRVVVSLLLGGLCAVAVVALVCAIPPDGADDVVVLAVMGAFSLLLLLQGLWLLAVPLVVAGPDGLRIRLTPWRPRRFALEDLLAVARAPGGRPRLLAREDGRERLYSLPIRTVSRANARRLVEWVHSHVGEQGTRVLRGRDGEWAQGDPPFLG